MLCRLEAVSPTDGSARYCCMMLNGMIQLSIRHIDIQLAVLFGIGETTVHVLYLPSICMSSPSNDNASGVV